MHILSRRIFLIVVTCLSGCLQKPDNETFEAVMDIRFPEQFTVLRNDYQKVNGQFVRYLELKMDHAAMDYLVNSIKASVYYDSSVVLEGYVQPENFIQHNGIRACWHRTNNGFFFGNAEKSHAFTAEVDTLRNLAQFMEAKN